MNIKNEAVNNNLSFIAKNINENLNGKRKLSKNFGKKTFKNKKSNNKNNNQSNIEIISTENKKKQKKNQQIWIKKDDQITKLLNNLNDRLSIDSNISISIDSTNKNIRKKDKIDKNNMMNNINTNDINKDKFKKKLKKLHLPTIDPIPDHNFNTIKNSSNDEITKSKIIKKKKKNETLINSNHIIPSKQFKIINVIDNELEYVLRKQLLLKWNNVFISTQMDTKKLVYF